MRDHLVTYRREEFIAEVALGWRQHAKNENFAYFNIVDFVEIVLRKEWKKRGNLRIEFFDAPPGGDRAYVTFTPLTLHIDEETWDLAKDGEPEARFVVAHEIGHIVLHQHDAQYFSNDPDIQIKFDSQERSAEWQANVFASYFLVPPRIMSAYDTIDDMKSACAVNEPFVLNRYPEEKKFSFRRVQRDGALCTGCGNFTRMSDGVCRSASCKNLNM